MITREKRRGVPPLFAQAGPLSCRIGAALAATSQPLAAIPQAGARDRARGPPRKAPDQDRDALAPQGRPIIPSPEMLLGQRSDPASPAVNQAPALNQQTKETW
jgi:hypothetical protein